ncbi:hypothetical protein ZOSMA_82G00080 [Zostera marina]|uniref:Uncharacterized protein n=1 Tax=Zostera marina TaxID=29655 RepID=A0A0K9NLS7_ZOSMR|nr:hypothetical protein ZOSMA_82G00080 [Zostera marina]
MAPEGIEGMKTAEPTEAEAPDTQFITWTLIKTKLTEHIMCMNIRENGTDGKGLGQPFSQASERGFLKVRSIVAILASGCGHIFIDSLGGVISGMQHRSIIVEIVESRKLCMMEATDLVRDRVKIPDRVPVDHGLSIRVRLIDTEPSTFDEFPCDGIPDKGGEDGVDGNLGH